MAQTSPSLRLTYEGAAAILTAAVGKASDMRVPQCITVVDSGGQLITMARMDGAFALSIDTALRKAQTAACYGAPTGHIAEGVDIKLAIATANEKIGITLTRTQVGDRYVVERMREGGFNLGGEQSREVRFASMVFFQKPTQPRPMALGDDTAKGGTLLRIFSKILRTCSLASFESEQRNSSQSSVR